MEGKRMTGCCFGSDAEENNGCQFPHKFIELADTSVAVILVAVIDWAFFMEQKRFGFLLEHSKKTNAHGPE